MINHIAKKRSTLMGNIMNVSHQKILLKEQGELEIEYVFSVVKIKMKLIKESEIKI